MKNIIIILILISPIPFLTCSNPERNTDAENFDIIIKVDPTVELICTIHRLAETHQYTRNDFSRYIRDVNDHFGSFLEHPAIKLTIKQNKENRINGSAPMALAVYLKNPPELISRNTLSPLPIDLDSRWSENTMFEFIKAAKEFSLDSKFMNFFNSHQNIYNQSTNNLYHVLKDEDLITWFQNYFGYKPEKFTIIIGMQTGYGNYGLSITHPDNTIEYISILGASANFWEKTPRFDEHWIIPTIVHEFSHSYINPLINENYAKLEVASEIIYRKNPPNDYFKSKIMLYEYLVRACVIRYFVSKNDFATIKRRIEIDRKDGFPAVEGLIELLERYEANRLEYATLSDFMPEIEHYFNEYAKSLN